jgi:hypothetical protein
MMNCRRCFSCIKQLNTLDVGYVKDSKSVICHVPYTSSLCKTPLMCKVTIIGQSFLSNQVGRNFFNLVCEIEICTLNI